MVGWASGLRAKQQPQQSGVRQNAITIDILMIAGDVTTSGTESIVLRHRSQACRVCRMVMMVMMVTMVTMTMTMG